MNSNTLEHLKLIIARIDKLLEQASKRTPGEWEDKGKVSNTIGKRSIETQEYFICAVDESEAQQDNATFIASCAGNAEAGWRATRVAIALLFAMCDGAHSINTVMAAEEMGKSILAAFPLELIQKP